MKKNIFEETAQMFINLLDRHTQRELLQEDEKLLHIVSMDLCDVRGLLPEFQSLPKEYVNLYFGLLKEKRNEYGYSLTETEYYNLTHQHRCGWCFEDMKETGFCDKLCERDYKNITLELDRMFKKWKGKEA